MFPSHLPPGFRKVESGQLSILKCLERYGVSSHIDPNPDFHAKASTYFRIRNEYSTVRYAGKGPVNGLLAENLLKTGGGGLLFLTLPGKVAARSGVSVAAYVASLSPQEGRAVLQSLLASTNAADAVARLAELVRGRCTSTEAGLGLERPVSISPIAPKRHSTEAPLRIDPTLLSDFREEGGCAQRCNGSCTDS